MTDQQAKYSVSATSIFGEDDVLQEIALFRLETGTQPRKDFIKHRLQRQLGGFSLSYEDPEALDQLAIPFVLDSDDESEGLEEDELLQLLSWASLQDPDVQIHVDIILGYDEGDPQSSLEILLKAFPKPRRKPGKASKKSHDTISHAATIRRLILQALDEHGPLPKDALIEKVLPAVGVLYQNRRPAAAIRQAIRSMTRKGQLVIDNNQVRRVK